MSHFNVSMDFTFFAQALKDYCGQIPTNAGIFVMCIQQSQDIYESDTKQQMKTTHICKNVNNIAFNVTWLMGIAYLLFAKSHTVKQT